MTTRISTSALVPLVVPLWAEVASTPSNLQQLRNQAFAAQMRANRSIVKNRRRLFVVQAVVGSNPIAHPHRSPANEPFCMPATQGSCHECPSIVHQFLDPGACPEGAIGFSLVLTRRLRMPVLKDREVGSDSEIRFAGLRALAQRDGARLLSR